MRIGVFTLLLIVLLPLSGAWAADDCDRDLELKAAVDCCRIITAACVIAKYRPLRDWPPHQCVLPCEPCCASLCIDPPPHQPVVPCEPCGWLCLPDDCHLPAVTADPVEVCECECSHPNEGCG